VNDIIRKKNKPGQMTAGVNGGGFAALEPNRDGEQALNDRDHIASLIRTISDQMRSVTEAQLADTSMVYRTLIAGSWLEHQRHSLHAIDVLTENEKVDVGLNDSAQEIYGVQFDARGDDEKTGAWFRTLTSATDAARAVANRHLIGTGIWDQNAYDTLTRPWSTIFGPVHPDDELNPPSWSKRPLFVEEVRSFSPETLARHTERAQVKDPEHLVISDLRLLLVEDRVFMAEDSHRDDVLGELSVDPDADVRWAVAQNPETNVDVLNVLLADRDPHVRDAAEFSLNS
jgi:hypothetical protein